MKKLLILVVSLIISGNVFAGVTCNNFKQYDITVDAVAAGIEIDAFTLGFGFLKIHGLINKSFVESGKEKIADSTLIPFMIQKECDLDSSNGIDNFKKNLKNILNNKTTEKQLDAYVARFTK